MEAIGKGAVGSTEVFGRVIPREAGAYKEESNGMEEGRGGVFRVVSLDEYQLQQQ